MVYAFCIKDIHHSNTHINSKAIQITPTIKIAINKKQCIPYNVPNVHKLTVGCIQGKCSNEPPKCSNEPTDKKLTFCYCQLCSDEHSSCLSEHITVMLSFCFLYVALSESPPSHALPRPRHGFTL